MTVKKIAKSSGRRAPEQAQISISLSRDLLARIDVAAVAEHRNRSNFIAAKLDAFLPAAKAEPKGKASGKGRR
jgi:metal-responsive CopG/Arc/MetJ family transcriptional regulator